MKNEIKEVKFSPVVNVSYFHRQVLAPGTKAAHGGKLSFVNFEAQRRKEMTCSISKKCSQDKTVPLINTDGKVCTERRVHQRTAIMAILSYQKHMQERLSKSSEFELLVSSVSQKLSQRAKDIALETARQTSFEVYPHLSSSNLAPINISSFPEIKKKSKKREHSSENIECNPQLKRSRHAHSI